MVLHPDVSEESFCGMLLKILAVKKIIKINRAVSKHEKAKNRLSFSRIFSNKRELLK
jgi:hypothetical protein